ncbi:MAG: hypothetical protein QNJ89_10965 [Acidimicrobiia bacterium]|nr:hypothetical protein [Acidimicrobiia bacterium]
MNEHFRHQTILQALFPDTGSARCAVVENGRAVQPSAIGPTDLNDPFYDAVDVMIRSMVITAEPRQDS